MPKDDQKVVGLSSEPALQVVSGDRGATTTIVSFISASGIITPPMVIFKGKRIPQYVKDVCPPDIMLRCSDTGYVNSEVFCQYAACWLTWMDRRGLMGNRQNKFRKNLILLDGHKSHLFNLGFLQNMQDHGVMVGALPPHTSHLLQPLDDAPFGNLKRAWQSALDKQNRATCAQRLTKDEFLTIFSKVFKESVTPQSARAGFLKCGIWPANPEATKLLRVATSLVSERRNVSK
jgi:hypothetical protein